MKLSKDLGKESWFYLLLLVGTFLLFAMFYSSPQSFWIHNLRWNINEETNRERNDVMVPPMNADIHPEKWSNDSTFDASVEKFEDAVPTKPICDFSDYRSDLCNMTGDVRTQGYNITTVFFVIPPSTENYEQEWSVNAYSQKMYNYFSKNVTVKQLRGPQNAPLCTIGQRNTPAILLSLGGPTGNIWHDFTDVIIPLFLASKPLNREVQFLLINHQQWFLDKFSLIFKDLSRYKVINFDEDKEIRCYRHMLVGLLNHKDLSIDPKRAFDGFDMYRFKLYIRSIYSLPMDVELPYKMDKHPEKKPRLMLVVRSKSRRFLNQEEITDVIEKNGFEVVQVEPKRSDNLTEMSKLVDSCDVLMGVHGAALTHILFLRTNAVMVQVLPLGGQAMDFYANSCYDEPADDMRLRRIDYHITPEESSLLDKYGWDDPVIKDPDSVNTKGWSYRQKYYWNEQDLRLNVTRFEPVLVKALELIKG
ncbi:Glycosyltransferase family 61 protein [Rhynchospora pubera]|uniref:Glycosyltransferase family 61 protein n=1 Tax=Rhynchospora pubera TaxID=906938 RepID=A0AAV8ESC7_9POAL|nr:Glycosyltransferase family 61 protein [Rhynchospora pubera]